MFYNAVVQKYVHILGELEYMALGSTNGAHIFKVTVHVNHISLVTPQIPQKSYRM